jgi:hypothetical protein
MITDNWCQGPNCVVPANRFDQFLESASSMDDLSFAQLQPVLFCHDQEPLHFDYYADDCQHMKEFICSIKN